MIKKSQTWLKCRIIKIIKQNSTIIVRNKIINNNIFEFLCIYIDAFILFVINQLSYKIYIYVIVLNIINYDFLYRNIDILCILSYKIDSYV